ncbi:MAG TPA: NAD(P)H-dependent oxidoreductase subunit E [Gemmatimonadales bacterium]|nr:NAD(P)H-dependent oxidoreductase subunit E [Gemmatimonadales bacterium]
MDLHFRDATPTDDERAAVDAVLGAPVSGWDGGQRVAGRDGHLSLGGHEARARRHLLLPALHAVQSRTGWLSEGALNYLSARLTVPLAEIWGVVTFYALLPTHPRPPRVLHVCDDIACRMRGAEGICERLEHDIGGPVSEAGHGATSETMELSDHGWVRSPCLGLCDQAPAALLTVAGERSVERLLGQITPTAAVVALRGVIPDELRARLPQKGAPGLRLLARVGVVDPRSLSAYQGAGGYRALAKAFDLKPEGVINEMIASKLMGRGGAAFPTGRKWDAVAKQGARPHYVICNADESEPGTFKDRVLMEEDPFAIVEAVTIAGYAVGAAAGYIYIRGEYPLAISRMQGAIDQARAAGLLGGSVMGQGFAFDVEIRKGAGAYICGEETAIFNSIEGYRGEPRNKPPFPVAVGLFRKPTLVNNVETLANVPGIILDGGAAFAGIGTPDSTGPKLFCVSGALTNPGVYEVPFGTTLHELIALAGGSREGRPLQAILLGGAAGMFVPGDVADIPLTFEGARAAGVTLGSGVVMAFDDQADLKDTLLRIAAFFRDESCGQCVPCRVGTVRQEEALHRLVARKPLGTATQELALLEEIGAGMKDASICGLGQTAYSAVESAVKRLKVFQ